MTCADLRIAITGGGIGGLALALALQKKNIPSIVFEKDSGFNSRSQGYGLTIQQGGKALKALNLIESLANNCFWSSSHFLFDSKGRVVLFWGPVVERHDAWDGRFCSHISRQSLRQILLENINPDLCSIVYRAELKDIETFNDHVVLNFKDDTPSYKALALVGADGIYSTVLKSFPHSPLQYLGVIVILGIASSVNFPLFHNRVTQTSDGATRIFIMPFDTDRSMWQLSFYMDYEEAKRISKIGPTALKEEALKRCQNFHDPIPDFLRITEEGLITGYPVYDREVMKSESMGDSLVTLIGDAAHCMSPFKGQGANQALLDSVNLAEKLAYQYYKRGQQNNPEAIKQAFRIHEKEMISRSTSKVLSSRECVKILHNPNLLSSEYQLKRREFCEIQSTLQLLKEIENRNIGAWSEPSELDRWTLGERA